MNAPFRTPASPPAAIMRILSRFDRHQLAGFIAVAIDLLDLADGDPDAEEIGIEDSFQPHRPDAPGCGLADGTADPAWIEWHNRLRHKVDRYGAEVMARDRIGNIVLEDAEDDDPIGQCDEDGVSTALGILFDHRGPGCKISDEDGDVNDDREPEDWDWLFP